METRTQDMLASMIDHTLLRKDASEQDFIQLCDEAKKYQFKTVCVEVEWLPFVAKKLQGSSVLPIAVVCFPEGTAPTSEKVQKTHQAIQLGAKEIDMVLNRGLLREKNYGAVLSDIKEVVQAAAGNPVKVILETSELSRDEKVIACVLAKLAGASFVKTSTGFSKSGANVEDVRLMREVVGKEMGVKASGGVRSQDDAIRMIDAGASRLGTSASVAIVTGKQGQSNY